MSKPRAKLPFSEETLQAMLIRVLRPLVKLALASGFNFISFSTVLRRLYIEVAEKEFALPNKNQTDSRISLLTGIHRKDVNRLRGQVLAASFLTVGVSQTSRILARWLADPFYCDTEDRPSALPRTSSDGGPSFESLVSDITKDVHPAPFWTTGWIKALSFSIRTAGSSWTSHQSSPMQVTKPAGIILRATSVTMCRRRS